MTSRIDPPTNVTRPDPKVFTYSPVTYKFDRTKIRSENTPLCSLIADALRESTNADISLVSSHSITSGILRGVVTKEELTRVFSNQEDYVVIARTTGNGVLLLLEHGLMRSGEQRDLGNGCELRGTGENGYICSGGLRYDVNSSAKPGRRVSNVHVCYHRSFSIDSSGTSATAILCDPVSNLGWDPMYSDRLYTIATHTDLLEQLSEECLYSSLIYTSSRDLNLDQRIYTSLGMPSLRTRGTKTTDMESVTPEQLIKYGVITTFEIQQETLSNTVSGQLSSYNTLELPSSPTVEDESDYGYRNPFFFIALGIVGVLLVLAFIDGTKRLKKWRKARKEHIEQSRIEVEMFGDGVYDPEEDLPEDRFHQGIVTR